MIRTSNSIAIKFDVIIKTISEKLDSEISNSKDTLVSVLKKLDEQFGKVAEVITSHSKVINSLSQAVQRDNRKLLKLISLYSELSTCGVMDGKRKENIRNEIIDLIKDKGAMLEHALANINLLLPEMWKNLGENDKWNIGTAYRDVVSEGNSLSANGLKKALLKVEGFDFVPENLRSTTFKTAARTVIETHFAFNNFYNEPSVVKALANLGSTIPAPALIDCIQAYLLIYLGNYYGVSNEASPIAYEELSKITRDRWHYYFEKVITKDEIILSNIKYDNQINRFSNLLINNEYDNFSDLPKEAQDLYNAIVVKKYSVVKSLSERLYQKIKK